MGQGPINVIDIHLVGHVCVDLTPRLPGPPDVTPGLLTEVGPMTIGIGGAVGNAARAVRELGRRAALSAAVGEDALGTVLREALERDFPGHVFLGRTGAATSYSVVVAPPGADRSFWHHTGANDEFDGSCELMGAPVVHFGYPTLCPGMTIEGGRPTVDLFRRARAQGSATSLDLAYCADNSPLRRYDWQAYLTAVLPWTDVFCPSWDDITSARNQPLGFDRDGVVAAADEFLALGAGVVLMTLGERGAYLATSGADRLQHPAAAFGVDAGGWAGVREWIPAAPVERILSTNGAGDTYKAAFLLAAQGAASPVEAAGRASVAVSRRIAGLPLGEAT